MLIVGGNQSAAGGYDVANSLRFDSGSSDYLERTPASEGNRKKWTWSAWIKRSKLGSEEFVFYSRASADNDTRFYFQSDTFRFQNTVSNSTNTRLFTNRVFRDISAWYHIVISYDSTVATPDTNSIQMFVNGVKETSFSATIYPSQNQDTFVNDDALHTVGRRSDGASNYFNGYMAEVVVIDGQALDPTSFGEFDEDTGIWKPINVSGLTFGTNGFYLDFEDSAALGDDVSGNGNDFTVNNLTSIDQSTDTCTNNFATLNPIQAALSSATFSEGNLKSVTAGTAGENYGGCSSIGVASGKWYFEAKATVGSGAADRNVIGVTGEASNIAYNKSYTGTSSTVQYQSYNGQVLSNNTTIEYTGSLYATGDIIQIALDIDNLHVYFGKNGTWQNSGDPTSGATGTGAVDLVAISSTTDGFYFVYHGDNSGASGPVSTFEFNFGSPSYSESGGNSDGNGYGNFNQSVPSGYYALNTKKFSGVWIMAYTDIDKPTDYFNTKLYTGDGTSSNAITGVGFQPDWVWLKARSSSYSHQLFDVVRGATKLLTSEAPDAEQTLSGVTSFDSDGFTVGSDAGSNNNTTTFASWNWLASNTTASNTDGDITSTVSVNTTSGFSIGTYSANATAGATVGHGLGVAPDWLMVKVRNSTNNWAVYHKSMGETKAMYLDGTSAETTDGWLNNTAPDSSVFTLSGGNYGNASGYNLVFYAFAEKKGFSKFGSYTGNGNADGTFVYTGFKPAFVLMKNASASATPWFIFDAKRNPSNETDLKLNPNSSDAESSANPIDILSNGFKLRTSGSYNNGSGNTIIYMCFAENPLVSTAGVPCTAR